MYSKRKQKENLFINLSEQDIHNQGKRKEKKKSIYLQRLTNKYEEGFLVKRLMFNSELDITKRFLFQRDRDEKIRENRKDK